MASEARMVDTINNIIGGLSSSITIPVQCKKELEQFHGKKLDSPAPVFIQLNSRPAR
jgi:hypothetical protein